MEAELTRFTRMETQVVVRRGRGFGLRCDVMEEVVHLSLQVVGSSQMQGVIQSQDPFEPHQFHSSRKWGLKVANERRNEIDALGFGGPAVAFRIPGIPFNQEQDAGLHISLYNQPKQDGVQYTPPDSEACAALDGKKFTLILADELKVLNGSEQNDSSVGGCYYISLACGKAASAMANDIKAKVGLPQDDTQAFHLSLATIAPSWLPSHPKSAVSLQAPPEQQSVWRDAFRIFRHGDSGCGFCGFNDDATTNWTTHGRKLAEAGKKNASVKAMIEALVKSDGYESRKLELQRQIVDIPKTLGFCSPVGSKEMITKIHQPDIRSQNAVNRKFNRAKRAPTSGRAMVPSRMMTAGGVAVVFLGLAMIQRCQTIQI